MSKEPRKSNAGAPTKWKPEIAEQVYNYALLGATDEQLAQFLNVHIDTIYDWANNNVAFSDARRKGKELADAKVAKTLFTRALGFTQETEKVFQYEGEVIRADTTTYFPPDVTAAIFWLKNRQPHLWRDRKQLEMETEEGDALAIPVVRVKSSKGEAEQ